MEKDVVARRIAELTNLLSQTESDIADIDTAMDTLRSDSEQTLLLMTEKHAKDVENAHRFSMDEFEADVALTQHFKSAASHSVIQTLLKQQDSVLLPEYNAKRESLLAIADTELQRRDDQYKKQEQEKLLEIFKVEEGKYLQKVHRAMNAHGERMLRLDGEHHDDE